MKVVEHHSAEKLQPLFQREKDARLAKRLWIVWQARLGQTEPQITVAIGLSWRVVQEWVRRYNLNGLVGLQDRSGRGRKPILSPEEKQRVATRVEEGPREGEVCSLRGLALQAFIYLWAIGAASPRAPTRSGGRGQAEAILSSVLNTAIINQFLSPFPASLAPDVHGVMIWDGAGFHRSRSLIVPTNITLLPLPPIPPNSTVSRTSGTISAATAGPTEPTNTTTPSLKPPKTTGENPASNPTSSNPSAPSPI